MTFDEIFDEIFDDDSDTGSDGDEQALLYKAVPGPPPAHCQMVGEIERKAPPMVRLVTAKAAVPADEDLAEPLSEPRPERPWSDPGLVPVEHPIQPQSPRAELWIEEWAIPAFKVHLSWEDYVTATSQNYPLDPTLGDFYVAYDEEQRDEYFEWCRHIGRMARYCMFEDEFEFEDDNPGAGSSSDAP